MSSSLLVLGGGPFSLPVLRWAREAGLETTLVDADPRACARRAAHAFQAIPVDDAGAHAALARRLQAGARQHSATLAGVLATEAPYLALLPRLSEAVSGCLPGRAALERALSAERTHAFLAERGFALATAGGEALVLHSFFRDGAFVPCILARRRQLETGDVLSLQPSGLAPAAMRVAFVLFERAARALGLEHGPLQATLVETGTGLALAELVPGFQDLLGASHVARLAYGKSPLQAWFAHLAGAGGPFDEPATAARAAAGWLAVAAPHDGIFAGIDNLARVRTLPGLADAWIDEPGRTLGRNDERDRPLAYLWAVGDAPETVEARLRAARAALAVRVAEFQRVG